MSRCIVLASIASRKSIAVAKSIRELLGLKIVGVAHTLHPHVFSRYFDRVHVVETHRYSAGWAYSVAFIAKECGCRFVLPIDYPDFYTFSRYAKLFEEQGVILISPPYESIIIASDRVRYWELLKDVAVFPRQVFVSSRSDIDRVYYLRPPLVVKGLGDASNPSFHLGYESAVEDAESRAPVVVQEYVEGVARGYYALSFNGVPILEFTHQRVVEYSPIGGASLGAKGIVRDPELFRLGRNIVAKLKWSGVIMVETRYSDEKGLYYVIELNPKFWGSIDLPEALGYRFSALLVSLYIYGYDYAFKLEKELMVRDGEFVWLLDALRYIPKIPGTWFRLAREALGKGSRSDIDVLDLGRNILQLLMALQRFSRERNSWAEYIEKSRSQLKHWVARYMDFLKSSTRVVVFDLDSTLIKLPVDWAELRRSLADKGFIHPWESINRALTRLWLTDRDSYARLSEEVKVYELRSVDNAKPLVKPKLLQMLREYTRICIASKQPVEVIDIVLQRLKLQDSVDGIIGRDSGLGPLKANLYRRCVELCGGGAAVVVDDNIEYVVEAFRDGYIPIIATSNTYTVARALRIGIPAERTNRVVEMLLHSLHPM